MSERDEAWERVCVTFENNFKGWATEIAKRQAGVTLRKAAARLDFAEGIWIEIA